VYGAPRVHVYQIAAAEVDADAVLSEWGPWVPGGWSACDSTGQQSRTETRTRTVITPATGNGTTGHLIETQTVSQSCPFDAVYSEWSEWAGGPWEPCSAEGTQMREETRTRTLIQPAVNGGSEGPLSETREAEQACEPPPPSTITVTCTVLTAGAPYAADGDVRWKLVRCDTNGLVPLPAGTVFTVTVPRP